MARKTQSQGSKTTRTTVGGLTVVSKPSVSSDVGSSQHVQADVTVDQVDDVTVAKTNSMESAPASFDTLFDAFKISAVASYNYYVAGEEHDSETNAALGKIGQPPRRVTVRWSSPSGPFVKDSTDAVSASSISAEREFPSVSAKVTSQAGSSFTRFSDLSVKLSAKNARTIDEVESKTELESYARESSGAVASARSIVAKTVPTKKRETKPASGYVGIVLQRESLVPQKMLGLASPKFSFVLDREVSLAPDSKTFVDDDVVFGRQYRYRVRTVFSWVHSADSGVEKSMIVQRRKTAGASYVETYFSSAWSDWTYATIIDDVAPSPPDELIVASMPGERAVRVAWRFPYDSQLDIDGTTLFRKRVDSATLVDVERWSPVCVLGATNGSYVDRDVELTSENGGLLYAYAATVETVHGERSALSEQVAVSIVEAGDSVSKKLLSSPGAKIDAFGNSGRITRASSDVPAVMASSCETSLALGDRRGAENPQPMVLRLRSLSTGQVSDVIVSGRYDDAVILGSSAAKRRV